MTQYYSFFRRYPAHLCFGFVMTFFSSLGQTFLISLYVPHILADLGLSNTGFGTLYALATVGSSVLLMNFGGRIDFRPLKGYVYRTVVLLSAASIALGLVQHYVFLPFALLGLRFAGQGLMTHISQTVLGRYFAENRGKALSLSSLGFSVGEMFFPLFIAVLIPVLGWRLSLAINAAVMLAVLLPVLRMFPLNDLSLPGGALGVGGHSVAGAQGAGGRGPAGSTGRSGSNTQWGLLKDRTFWSLMPAFAMLSLTTTGYFFYQLVFAQSRGWPAAWYGLVFTGYAVSRFSFGLVGGVLVDRFGARRLFSLHLTPFVLGLVLVALVPSRWAAVVFLLLAGVSIGSSSSIKSALIAELHGTATLGGVRSVYTAFMVLGTALGPMIFGVVLDLGIGFSGLLTGSAVVLLVSILPTLRFWGDDAVPMTLPVDTAA